VGNTGAVTQRSINTTASTYQNMNFESDRFRFRTPDDASATLSIEDSATTGVSYVGVRATGDTLHLIGDNTVVADFDTSKFVYSPSGHQMEMSWDGTGLEVTMNGTETFGGSAVLAIESRQANHASVIFGANGVSGSTGRLCDMVDTSSGGNRYGNVRCYRNGTWITKIEGHALGLDLVGFDNGSSGGRYISLGENTNATGEPGYIRFYDENGADWFLWVDTSGNLTIHSSRPSNGTAGTHVGTQT